MFRTGLKLSRAVNHGKPHHMPAPTEQLVSPHSSPLTLSLYRNPIELSSTVSRCSRYLSTNHDASRKAPKHGVHDGSETARRKSTTSQQASPSVSPRRVPSKIESSRGNNRKVSVGKKGTSRRDTNAKLVIGYCAAEQYNIPDVCHALEKAGYTLDPHHTDLYPQVVHVQISPQAIEEEGTNPPATTGDIFVFSAGTVVAWDVSEKTILNLIYQTLLPAAENAHSQTEIETEDLEFLENPTSPTSSIVGDKIHLGTAQRLQDPSSSSFANQQDTDQTLMKIAFSSGLSRSVKLAVLENKLEAYVTSTRSIPTQLARGQRLPFTRSFVLRKTGELLEARAQLNLNSELTDALPDMFWDSRHELGLEGCFDAVGRALDVSVRTRELNRKMTYAQEIVAVLREQLHERHGYALEWLIIALISIEVGFEVLRLWKGREKGVEVDVADRASKEDAALLRMYLATAMDKVLKSDDGGKPDV